MPGLAGTRKDKKNSSLSSKLELKGLVKPETTFSTRSTLHLSKLNTGGGGGGGSETTIHAKLTEIEI